MSTSNNNFGSGSKIKKKSSSFTNLPSTHCDPIEFVLLFRVVANLNNWSYPFAESPKIHHHDQKQQEENNNKKNEDIKNEDIEKEKEQTKSPSSSKQQQEPIPRFLDMDNFARAATILQFEKPGRMFMDLTNNAEKSGVSQAELALYYAHKKKTFRFVNQSKQKKQEDKENQEEKKKKTPSPDRKKISFVEEESTITKASTSNQKEQEEPSSTTFLTEQQQPTTSSSSSSSSDILLKQAKAALTIQCAQRQRRSRQLTKSKRFTNLDEKRKLEQECDQLTLLYATLKIQCGFRQRKSRTLLRTKKFVKMNENKRLEDASIEQEKEYLASGVLEFESGDDEEEEL